ncbi:hypothetical protein DENSPDRAFT_840125 [Dentipellis sp. KUC8613]|nr:hypothetical protein DENSPDRAFT_840125 [Dentipellis sp. KUC8613]
MFLDGAADPHDEDNVITLAEFSGLRPREKEYLDKMGFFHELENTGREIARRYMVEVQRRERGYARVLARGAAPEEITDRIEQEIMVSGIMNASFDAARNNLEHTFMLHTKMFLVYTIGEEKGLNITPVEFQYLQTVFLRRIDEIRAQVGTEIAHSDLQEGAELAAGIRWTRQRSNAFPRAKTAGRDYGEMETRRRVAVALKQQLDRFRGTSPANRSPAGNGGPGNSGPGNGGPGNADRKHVRLPNVIPAVAGPGNAGAVGAQPANAVPEVPGNGGARYPSPGNVGFGNGGQWAGFAPGIAAPVNAAPANAPPANAYAAPAYPVPTYPANPYPANPYPANPYPAIVDPFNAGQGDADWWIHTGHPWGD